MLTMHSQTACVRPWHFQRSALVYVRRRPQLNCNSRQSCSSNLV